MKHHLEKRNQVGMGKAKGQNRPATSVPPDSERIIVKGGARKDGEENWK